MEKIEYLINSCIMAIVPEYVKNKGNAMLVITKNSSPVYIYRRLVTVLRWIGKYFFIDISAAKRFSRDVLGHSNIVPIPFNIKNIFIPLKVRSTLSKNDSAFGYFNMSYIKDIKKQGEQVFVSLDNDIDIQIIQRYETAKRHFNDGEIIQRIYNNRQYAYLVMEDSADFYKKFNQPATKGDIASLRNEIIDLLNTISK
ncbi:competence protein ComK [Clostridiisalibacter paucivorans]|uniref:competence protein ComK n=1 Tax=Clostridiisalibacter paucivorans TaxID=408753 RepID=UPI00047CF9C3|nr:competence protein ComK [Clostridiisalibacter paucivorans]